MWRGGPRGGVESRVGVEHSNTCSSMSKVACFVGLLRVVQLNVCERFTMGAMSRARFVLLHPACAARALDSSCFPPRAIGMTWSTTNASGSGVRVPGR